MGSRKENCDKHNLSNDSYCETCKEAFCGVCRLDFKHKDHQVQVMDNAGYQVQQMTEQLQQHMRALVEEQKKHMEEMMKNMMKQKEWVTATNGNFIKTK